MHEELPEIQIRTLAILSPSAPYLRYIYNTTALSNLHERNTTVSLKSEPFPLYLNNKAVLPRTKCSDNYMAIKRIFHLAIKTSF